MKTSDYLSSLFEAADVVHMAHLSTRVFARHEALKLYSTLRDFVDSFAEIYMGKTGELIDFVDITASPVPDSEIEEYLASLIDILVEAKNEFATNMEEYGNFVNDIETLISEIQHTIYKLKFLG